MIFASLNLPRPVVLVSAHSATDTPMVGPVHDGLMEIGVHLIVDAKDADRELLRLVADVGRAVQSDERLGGLATFSRWTHYRLRDDIMEKGDGSTAVATLALEVLYTTNHDGS